MYTYKMSEFSLEHSSFGCLVIKVMKVDQSGCDRIVCLCVLSCVFRLAVKNDSVNAK